MEEFLEKVTRYLKENKINAYAVAEYKNGKITYKRLQKNNRMNNIYSISKNFTATAIGMLVYRGKLSLTDRAIGYLGGFAEGKFDEKWKRITVAHLLTHTWGQDCGNFFEAERFASPYKEGEIVLQDEHASIGKDWLERILTEKLPLEPGERMSYSNASYYLLSRIAENITGKKLFDWLREELFTKMNFHGYAAGCCPKGHTLGATEMFFCIEDLVKLGVLYLQHGIYNNERFFSDRWANEASRPRASANGLCYGYGFWKTREDFKYYYASGAHAQLLVIDEENERVFAMQGYDDWDEKKFFTAIYPAPDKAK